MAGINTLARLQIALGLDSSDIASGAQAVRDEFGGIKGIVEETGQAVGSEIGGALEAAQTKAVDAANGILGAVERVNDGLGNTGDTIRVGLLNTLDEARVTAENTADSMTGSLGGAASRIGDFFEANHSKIREFGRAGSELSIVMSALGGDFEQLLGPVGEFVHLAGDAGLVVSAIADLGPAAAGGIAGVLGLGQASAAAEAEVAGLGVSAATATPELVGLGVAADVAATGGVATLAGVLSALAVPVLAVGAAIGGTVAVFSAGVGALTNMADASRTAAQAQGDLAGAQARLNPLADDYDIALKNVRDAQYQQADAAELAAGKTNAEADAYARAYVQADGYLSRVNDLATATLNLTNRQIAAVGVVQSLAGGVRDLLDPLGTLDRILTGVNNATNQTAIKTLLADGYFRQFTTDAGETGAGLDNIGAKAIAAANGLDTTGTAAQNLTTDLNSIPRNIDVNVNLSLNTATIAANAATNARNRLFGEDTGDVNRYGGVAVPPSSTQNFTPDELAANQFKHDQQQAAARAAQQAADAAARQAAQARSQALRDEASHWRDLAADAKQATEDMFTKLKASADAYFLDVHNRRLADIRDAQAAADAQIDAQERANNAALDALRKNLTAKQAAERLEQLQNAITTAQAAVTANPNDQSALDQLRQAKQALSDFEDQQQIDALQASTDAANAQLDAQKKAQDAQYAAQAKAEDDRYNAQIKNFNASLDALKTALERHPEQWQKAQEDVLGLLKKYGVDYETAGATLGDKFASGLRSEVNKLITDAHNWSDDLLKAAGLERLATSSTGKHLPASTSFSAGLPVVQARDVSAGVSGQTLNLNVVGQVDGQTLLSIIQRDLALSSSALTSGTGPLR